MSTKELEFLKLRGSHIQKIVSNLRVWFIKNPYPIELRKVAYTYGAGAKKFGGINQILGELECDGVVRIDVIETARGLIQTVMLCEFDRHKQIDIFGEMA